ncbi:MAG: hypothetical protein ACYTAS_20045 [Planctomycetota bacterium]|jgi:hypothetical protein
MFGLDKLFNADQSGQGLGFNTQMKFDFAKDQPQPPMGKQQEMAVDPEAFAAARRRATDLMIGLNRRQAMMTQEMDNE